MADTRTRLGHEDTVFLNQEESNEKETSFGVFLPNGYILANRYKIEYFSGKKKAFQGGFGIIYKAKDLQAGFDNYVAIKEFMPKGYAQRLAGGKLVSLEEEVEDTDIFKWAHKKFREEANVTNKCRHTNVVGVSCVFEENGTSYMVMEYIEGITLREYSKTSKNFYKDFPNIIKQSLNAIENVHKQGYFHRDITPDNIMIQTDGTVKLIDFGAFSKHDLKIGEVSKLINTEGFSPPERGKKDEDASSDIYSFCATLYSLITGKDFDEYESKNEFSKVDKSKYSKCLLESITEGLKYKQDERPRNIQELRKIMDENSCDGSTGAKIVILSFIIAFTSLGVWWYLTTQEPKEDEKPKENQKELIKYSNKCFSFSYPNSFKIIKENSNKVILTNSDTELFIDIQENSMNSSIEKLYKNYYSSCKTITYKNVNENSFVVYNSSKYKKVVKDDDHLLRIQTNNLDNHLQDIEVIAKTVKFDGKEKECHY